MSSFMSTSMTEHPQTRPSHTRRSITRALVIVLVAALAIVIAVLLVPFRPPTAYRFITAGHPIDVMNDGTGRWFYYMPDPPNGGAPGLAQTVRKELLPNGFTEDKGNAPWFRFVKGSSEVIVCNHDEIMTVGTSATGATVQHESIKIARQGTKWPVLWVHEPGSDTASVAAFKVKKLLLGW